MVVSKTGSLLKVMVRLWFAPHPSPLDVTCCPGCTVWLLTWLVAAPAAAGVVDGVVGRTVLLVVELLAGVEVDVDGDTVVEVDPEG